MKGSLKTPLKIPAMRQTEKPRLCVLEPWFSESVGF